MKKLLLLVSILFVASQANAQLLRKPKYKVGLGLSYISPFYGLSVKYALTQNHVIEGIAAPTSSFIYGFSFYGGRYIYRLPFHSLPFAGRVATSYPYLFAGAGTHRWSYNDYDIHKENSSMGYLGGIGYELIAADHFGLAGEIAYSRFAGYSAWQGTFTYGLGLHYYIGRPAKRAEYQGTTVTRDQPGTADSLVENSSENANDENDGLVNADTVKHKHRPRYKLGVAVVYTHPFYSFSGKLAVSEHSVIQLMASPTPSYVFYGARYIYRFPIKGKELVHYPYLFGGAGVELDISYYPDAGYYSAGGGYELIIGRHFGISGEIGFTQYVTTDLYTESTITAGGGIHYYIGRNR